jgi:hypothetical protein
MIAFQGQMYVFHYAAPVLEYEYETPTQLTLAQINELDDRLVFEEQSPTENLALTLSLSSPGVVALKALLIDTTGYEKPGSSRSGSGLLVASRIDEERFQWNQIRSREGVAQGQVLGRRLLSEIELIVELINLSECELSRCLLVSRVQNNVLELFNLLSFLDAKKFNNADEWMDAYGELNDAEKLKKIHSDVQPYVLRRTRKEVLTDLVEYLNLTSRLKW